ncbi:MAG: multifunctional CCA addition/repair protein [Reinekea sp.]
MKAFLVGGAVRDTLLGLPVKDRDWVVVGSTPNQLRSKGYQQVGADFPVFLHPETKEEYALARTERKSGKGYTGFTVQFSPDVTLEQDLSRRDLTINAMAMDDAGNIVDPFNGKNDLEQRKLRHVSEAFCEDPLRVLRTARFSARFAHLGFEIANETVNLIQQMVKNGELATLVAERVWSEMSRALTEQSPEEYFKTLKHVGALKSIFPELDQLFGVPQTMLWHPEVDTGIHTLKALQQARKATSNTEILMSTLCHDLGKALTPANILPSHHGHERSGADLIRSIAKSYKWPTKVASLCEDVARYHTHAHNAFNLKPATILKLLNDLGAFRQPEQLEKFLTACSADIQGRSGFENRSYPQAAYLKECLQACSEVTAKPFIRDGKQGKAIGEAIYRERLRRISDTKAAIKN